MKILMGLLLAGLASTCHADCHLQFNTANQSVYQENQIAQFVVDKIRPALQQQPRTLEIDVKQFCDDGSTATVVIQMDTQRYYLVQIQGHTLTEVESTYVTSDFPLSLAELNRQVAQAANFNGLPQPVDRQNVVKELAFFLAESARFTDVEQVVTSLTNSTCQQSWLPYAHLVRRWSVLSVFSTADQLAGGTVRGGAKNTLIAPISNAAIDQYNATITKGKGAPLAKYVDPRDWQDPIEVPAQSCR